MEQQSNVTRGTPLRVPHVVLMSVDGREIWEGSLLQFIRDNGMSRPDAEDLIAQLRPREDVELFEPAVLGGGAAPISYLLLVEPPHPAVARCEHGHFPLVCEECAR